MPSDDAICRRPDRGTLWSGDIRSGMGASPFAVQDPLATIDAAHPSDDRPVEASREEGFVGVRLTGLRKGSALGPDARDVGLGGGHLAGGQAVNLSDWDGRPGMVFANNACYSQSSYGLRMNGSTGVEVVGNVVFGSVTGAPPSGSRKACSPC